jgi:hypothetical protein
MEIEGHACFKEFTDFDHEVFEITAVHFLARSPPSK